jgi:leucyl-tRNA synthetase
MGRILANLKLSKFEPVSLTLPSTVDETRAREELKNSALMFPLVGLELDQVALTMCGFNVLHPMGWDAFGLPAEQFAIKNKVHPREAVARNIANFKAQLQKINFDYDWDREINTTDPKFYKWTQWIFKQLYKHDLAYESFEPINWCPSCKTGLANEDLDGNACERCSSVVEKKPLRQWNLRITKYADRMLDDLDLLDWPEHIKIAQRNWIGRSEGSEIDFKIISVNKSISFSEHKDPILLNTVVSSEVKADFESKFKIFTTRADTLFGCTYTVLAPEHELVAEMLNANVIQNKEEVIKYLEEVKTKTDIERSAEGKEKTGVRLVGVVAINPAI